MVNCPLNPPPRHGSTRHDAALAKDHVLRQLPSRLWEEKIIAMTTSRIQQLVTHIVVQHLRTLGIQN